MRSDDLMHETMALSTRKSKEYPFISGYSVEFPSSGNSIVNRYPGMI